MLVLLIGIIVALVFGGYKVWNIFSEGSGLLPFKTPDWGSGFSDFMNGSQNKTDAEKKAFWDSIGLGWLPGLGSYWDKKINPDSAVSDFGPDELAARADGDVVGEKAGEAISAYLNSNQG